MIKANVKHNLVPVRNLSAEKIENMKGVILPQMHADMDSRVPMLTGQLRQESYVDYQNETIVYDTPYAGYMYHNQFENYSTPNTGPFWGERTAEQMMPVWETVAQRALK